MRSRSAARTATARPMPNPTLRTSGPCRAARRPQHGPCLRQFPTASAGSEWIEAMMAAAKADPALDRRSETSSGRSASSRTSVDPATPVFNAKAARAKLVSRYGRGKPAISNSGTGIAGRRPRAPRPGNGVLHLHLGRGPRLRRVPPAIEANWKTKSHRYEGGETRNFRPPYKGPAGSRAPDFPAGQGTRPTQGQPGLRRPLRSFLGAGIASPRPDSQPRTHLCCSQPADQRHSRFFLVAGSSPPHFPHTVRKTETKTCLGLPPLGQGR